MSFEPRDYLRHILVEIDDLMRRRPGLTYEEFERDEADPEATRQTLIIGGREFTL
jgi:uncharacterized protein with HEPN domain